MAEKRRRQHGTGSVIQRKDGRWVGRVDIGWTPRGTRQVRSVYASSEAECKRRLRELQRQIAAEGAAPVARAGATVASWAPTWIALRERTVRPKTAATEASTIRRWVVPTIGRQRLDRLTPADLRRVESAVLAAGRTPSTAGHAVGTTRRMLAAAAAEGHEVPRRVLDVAAHRPSTDDRDAIDRDDALALLQAARDTPGGSRWVAAFLAGIRQGEALGLTWDRVDLDNGLLDVSWQLQAVTYADRAAGTFRVPPGYEARHLAGAYHLTRPKTARGRRVIPLVPWLATELAAWREAAPANPWGLVWPAHDRRGGGDLIVPCGAARDRAAWIALQDRARVAHLGEDGVTGRRYLVHEIRHTTATLLLEAGVDPATVTAILGHSSIVTSRGYQHVGQALARRALDDVAGLLGIEG